MKIQVFDRRAITVASLSVLLVVGCVGAAFTWLYSRVVSVIDQDAVAAIQRDLTVTAAIYRDSGREGVVKALRPAMDSLPPGRVVALVDAQGRLLIGNHDAARVNFAVVGEQAVLEHPGGRIMVVTRRFADGSRVIVGQNDLRHGELARNLISAALAATVVALLAAMLIGVRFNRYIIERIARIAAAAREISRGQMRARAPEGQRLDAIGEFAQIFNEMLDRNEALLTGMRTVTESLSHDLRTPLMRMRRAIGRARRAESPVVRDDHLAEAELEAERAVATFNALIELARAEAGLSRDAMQRIDLAALVSDAAELYEPLAAEKGQSLHVRPLPLNAVVHRQILLQALGNLLENAIKYAPPGTAVSVSVEAPRGGAGPTLVIEDQGPGIPANAREQAMRPFVRLESAVGTTGSGLGLAIAAAAAKLHGGQLLLEDARPGLRVRLELGVSVAAAATEIRPVERPALAPPGAAIEA
ncbi:MAG: HAMP domain-containing sensor histidine kinase [Steroidobacteraceae bacterium]